MRKMLILEVLAPLLRRLGTYTAGVLTSLGVATDDISTIVAGGGAVIMVLVDLGLSHTNRKRGGK